MLARITMLVALLTVLQVAAADKPAAQEAAKMEARRAAPAVVHYAGTATERTEYFTKPVLAAGKRQAAEREAKYPIHDVGYAKGKAQQYVAPRDGGTKPAVEAARRMGT